MPKPQGGMNGTYSNREKREIMIRFLKSYAKHGVFSRACDEAVVSGSTIRRWLKDNENFAEKYEEMQDRFVDSLEMIAVERAKEKSDSLMALLLRANRPTKYRDNHKIESENKNLNTVQLVFSKDEWGEEDLPNYATGEGVDHGNETTEE